MPGLVLLILVQGAGAAPDVSPIGITMDLQSRDSFRITFNVHDKRLLDPVDRSPAVDGDPRPIYLQNLFMVSGGRPPASLGITRIGNSCISLDIAYRPRDIREEFSFTYAVIAGDKSEARAEVIVQQGGQNFTDLTNDPDACDDPENLPPTAPRAPFDTQTQAGTERIIDLAADLSSVGLSDPNGYETLRFTAEACWANSPPTSGTVERVSDTQIRYIPAPRFVGPVSFDYCVTDNPLSPGDIPVPATNVVQGTVNIEVQAAGAPELEDDTATTLIDEPVDIDVKANDPIGYRGTIQAVGTPAQGGTAEFIPDPNCNINTSLPFGCIRYTPPPADADGVVFVGTDSFTYTVADPNGNTAQASVVVTVEAAPGTPEANPDQVTGVLAGVPTEIDVLANDTGSTVLTIVDVSAPAHGAAAITTTAGQAQVITYTADDTFTGNDSFVYTISDTDPNSIDRVGRVTIGVIPPTISQILEPFAQNATQRATADAIDVVCPALNELQLSSNDPLTPGQEALLDRCSALIEYAEDTQDVSGVSSALQQIAGEEVLAQGTTGTRIINTQLRNIGSRLASLRAGVRGISAQGLAMNLSSGSLPVGALLNRPGAGASADDAETEGTALLTDSRLGLFLNGRLNYGEQDSSLNENGFDFDTYGITAGADYRFRNDFVVGGSIGYADSTVDYNFDGGDLETQGWNYSLYGTYYTNQIYVDFLAGTGSANFDTRRILIFDDNRNGVDTVALGATEGDQRLASMSAGYNFERGRWVIAPYIGYDYMSTEVDAYDEIEGAGWELSFDAQDIKSRVITGGLRIAYNVQTGFGVFVPHFRLLFSVNWRMIYGRPSCGSLTIPSIRSSDSAAKFPIRTSIAWARAFPLCFKVVCPVLLTTKAYRGTRTFPRTH